MARRLLVATLLVALAAPSCSRGGNDDDAYTLQLDGRAEVVRGDEPSTLSSGDHSLAAGDVVRMVEGNAVLELPGERSMLLRAGRANRDATVVDVSDEPEVVDGDVVVIAGDEVRFTAGGVEVRLAAGAARVQRALGVTVGLYAGTADVLSAGRELPGGLAALRQVSVPATGMLPRGPSPLLYDEVDPDPWDREFLGEAIDLGIDLDRRARGFTGQLGSRVAVDAPLLRRVLPTLGDETGFGDDLLGGAQRSAGESLVGAAIVVESGVGAFRDRWLDVFSFRDDGARWGLVAFDQKVKRDVLLGTINDAFTRSPLLFAAPGRVGGGLVATGPTTTNPNGGDTTTTIAPPGGGGDDPTPTVPPTTVPPATVPPITVPLLPEQQDPDGAEPPVEGSSDAEPDAGPDVVDVVREVIDDLLGEDPPRPAAVGRRSPRVVSSSYHRSDVRTGARRSGGAQGLLAELPRLRPERGAGVPRSARR